MWPKTYERGPVQRPVRRSNGRNAVSDQAAQFLVSLGQSILHPMTPGNSATYFLTPESRGLAVAAVLGSHGSAPPFEG